ncbi:MAG: hypothetical protein HQM10_18115 [Candidatus Riflebacteria bacterium]|nr:hypothetical protein [Candidatus Riflebacteria bacterium]
MKYRFGDNMLRKFSVNKILTFLSVMILNIVLFNNLSEPRICFAQEPGTVGDPLVSKSYIDQFFKFRSMVVSSAGKLNLNSGCLVVLKSGSLVFRAPKGKSLIDLTTGNEIHENTPIPLFHLILAPDSSACYLEARSLSMVMISGYHPPDGQTK